MAPPLIINARIQIPRDELKMTFVRSSGPGGQNVNKVNTKVLMRWDVTTTTRLTQGVRQRFLVQFARRIAADGYVSITSQRFRDQSRNVNDCMEKLRQMIIAVLEPPKKRKATRPTRSAMEGRLKQKREMSQKKQGRGFRPDQDD